MRRSIKCAFLLLAFSGPHFALFGQAKGATPADCVSVRYVTGTWLNRSGTALAYVVKTPDLNRNRNIYELRLRPIASSANSSDKLIFSGDDITEVQWFDHDRHLAVLANHTIIDVNLKSSSAGQLVKGIETDAFAMDSSGSTIAYRRKDATKITGPETSSGSAPSAYRIDLGRLEEEGYPTYTMVVRHRGAKGWGKEEIISVQNPWTGISIRHLINPEYLSISPDARFLYFAFRTTGVPNDWLLADPSTREVVGTSAYVEVGMLYSVDSRESHLAIKSLFPSSTPAWTPDSRSLFLNAHSPIGSAWLETDIKEHHNSAADANLFRIQVSSRQVEEVVAHLPDHHVSPLYVSDNEDIVVLASNHSVAVYSKIARIWCKSRVIDIPVSETDRLALLQSDGRFVTGIHETVTSADSIFVYRQGDPALKLVFPLNPQLERVRFAEVKTIGWTTSEGLHIRGLLFLPPGFRPNTRYPLVIQTKGTRGWFTCDSGANHDPSFVPQPLANAGILYLIRLTDESWNFQDEVAHRPKDFPGGIGEAVQEMDIWDSAITELSNQGIVDPARVGIIGFSRTGWEVEFDLVNSRITYAAATATDNTQYSLSEYWLDPWGTRDLERMFGGPPYGSSLKAWEKYSISFNVDKIHAPLLMEEMGYGTHQSSLQSIPRNLAVRYEVTTGLTRLHKPVELYYYPDEQHQLDDPQERLASLSLNLDWYRYWLQDYVDPSPSKRAQYLRWDALRKLRDRDRVNEKLPPACKHPEVGQAR